MTTKYFYYQNEKRKVSLEITDLIELKKKKISLGKTCNILITFKV